MLLKTFQGADLATALALARQELGPDALVLATREIQAGCGGRGVEVTVGSTRREDARPASLEVNDWIAVTLPGRRLQSRDWIAHMVKFRPPTTTCMQM